MAEWEPIDTAPKDGTMVLLIGSRHKSEAVEEIRGSYQEGYTEGWEDERGSWFHPTGWQPLPEPSALTPSPMEREK